ncbi:unnamed protein product, partial [Rotaria sordida]
MAQSREHDIDYFQ